MKKIRYIISLFVFLGLIFVLLFNGLQKNETEETINKEDKEYVSEAPDVKTRKMRIAY